MIDFTAELYSSCDSHILTVRKHQIERSCRGLAKQLNSCAVPERLSSSGNGQKFPRTLWRFGVAMGRTPSSGHKASPRGKFTPSLRPILTKSSCWRENVLIKSYVLSWPASNQLEGSNRPAIKNVAANRHPGQVGYSLSPPQEVRDEESSLRADPGEEGEGSAAHAATCAARERQRKPDLPFFRSVQGAFLHLEEAL